MALGTFATEQAADFLSDECEECVDGGRGDSEWLGQKISYQTGKLQIVRMIEDARLKQGEQFSVRKFHDYVWLNGKCQSPCNAGSIWEWTMRCASLGGLK